MKHRDARVSAMCKHLRDAVTLWEEIQLYPFAKPEPERHPPPLAAPRAIQVFPSEKLAYSVKEAAIALSVGRTTLWRAIKDGELTAARLGARTLITVECLQEWLAKLPKRTRL